MTVLHVIKARLLQITAFAISIYNKLKSYLAVVQTMSQSFIAVRCIIIITTIAKS